MTAPRVLVLVSYKVFPARMGGQKCVAEFYRQLAGKTKLVLAVARENDVVTEEPFRVLPFLYNHWWGPLNICYLYRLAKLIRDEGIDLVIAEHSYSGWLGVLLRRITGKPLVIRSHNIETLRFRDLRRPWWRLYGSYERWVHRKASHSFFITSEDRAWAIQHWQLKDQACTVVPYGTSIQHPLPEAQRALYRQELVTKHAVAASAKLFLFNGSLDYLPNTDALRIILTELLPRLQPLPFDFRIIICGNGLSPQWEKALRARSELIYTGFVEDIDLYFKGADVFINPVTLGGGVKIKLAEALAHNQTAISTRTGARGIPAETAGKKLIVVEDYDWPAFVKNMYGSGTGEIHTTPNAFYAWFNWDVIVQKALLSLQTL